jgi:hypothetical protein
MFSLLFSLIFISNIYTQHFSINIEETGESTLFIFQDTIGSLDIGDEVGLFDSSGTIDLNGNEGEILVGTSIWDGEQLSISTIMSQDLSDFGGPILPGSNSGNTMMLKIWDISSEVEYSFLEYDIVSGSGSFNGLFTAISEVYLPEPHFFIDIEETGESTLFIFQDTISSLDIGDEIGLFDSNGIIDSEGNQSELLVGSGIWNGQQLSVVGIMSQDLSDFGGPILPGANSGNIMMLKVWDMSAEVEY